MSSSEKLPKICQSPINSPLHTLGPKRESSIARKLSNGKYFYLEDLTSAAVTRISEAQTAEGNKDVSSVVGDDRLHLLIAQLPEEIREMVFKDNGFTLLNDALASYPFEEAMQHIAAFEQVAAIFSKRRFKALRDELFPLTLDSRESKLFYARKYKRNNDDGADSSSNDSDNNHASGAIDLDNPDEATKIMLSVSA